MKDVMVYALSTCPFCRMAKNYFESRQIQHNSVEVDLMPEEEKEATLKEVQQLSGRRAFPVIVIGEKVIVGYDELQIVEALEK